MTSLRNMLLDGMEPNLLFDMYARNQFLVDFVLFASLFTSVTWATLQHRFPGRPGRVLSACLGFALSLSLTFSMARRNISLMDISWLPVLLLLLIAGLVVASLLKQSKVGVPTGGGVVVVIFAFMLASTMDRPRDSFDSGPIFSIFAIILILRLMLAVGSQSIPTNGRDRQEHIPAVRPVDRKAAQAMAVGTANMLDRNNLLGRQIERIREVTARGHAEPKDRDALSAAVDQAAQHETELTDRLTRIGKLAQRLEWADAAAYVKLRKSIRHADAKERPELSRQMVFEWAKIEEELNVYRLAHTAVRQAQHIRHCLDKVKDCIKADRIERGGRWLALAQKRQEKLGVLLTDLAKWELRLEEIARRQEAERAGGAP